MAYAQSIIFLFFSGGTLDYTVGINGQSVGTVNNRGILNGTINNRGHSAVTSNNGDTLDGTINNRSTLLNLLIMWEFCRHW